MNKMLGGRKDAAYKLRPGENHLCNPQRCRVYRRSSNKKARKTYVFRDQPNKHTYLPVGIRTDIADGLSTHSVGITAARFKIGHTP